MTVSRQGCSLFTNPPAFKCSLLNVCVFPLFCLVFGLQNTAQHKFYAGCKITNCPPHGEEHGHVLAFPRDLYRTAARAFAFLCPSSHAHHHPLHHRHSRLMESRNMMVVVLRVAPTPQASRRGRSLRKCAPTRHATNGPFCRAPRTHTGMGVRICRLACRWSKKFHQVERICRALIVCELCVYVRIGIRLAFLLRSRTGAMFCAARL